jgi:glutamate-1-semialdehyde 2,1-aminomutase
LLIEPVLVTGRVVAPAPGFLPALQSLARRHGALAILDDCLMLRLAVGGSVEKFGLDPDLVVLGKFLGGGTPMGALCGPRHIMRVFDPTAPGCLFHGGSFNGNPPGCAAGAVTLGHLTAARIDAMDAASVSIRTALAAAAGAQGLDVDITGFGSVTGVAFRGDTERHEDNPSAIGLASLFLLACLNEGLLLGPGGIIALSTAHDDAAVAHATQGIAAAFVALASRN